MGIERTHPPKYWRKRAELFRTKANDCGNARTRRALQKAAEQYQRLAQLAEAPYDKGPRSNRWSDVEIAKLRSLAGTMPVEELANCLGRSVSAVLTKASLLHVSTAQRRPDPAWRPLEARRVRRPDPLSSLFRPEAGS